MSLNVTTTARSTRLVHREDLKTLMGLEGTTYDKILDILIAQASSAIAHYCRRPFAREAVVETLPGYGGMQLQLARTPVISVSSVTESGSVIADWSIEDRDEGTLYRQLGWAWSAQAAPGLTGRQRWPGGGTRMPQHEEPIYVASFVAGYLLPSQDVLEVATLSAAAADNSFNDSGNGIPSLLAAGDVVESFGFATPANLGRFTVVSAAAGKVVVSGGTLVNESADAGRSLRFRARADVKPFDDVEKACVEAVKAWFQGRERDPNVTTEKVGDLENSYGDSGGRFGMGSPEGLPPSVVGLLRPWRRAA